jgi:hypothetical protein
MYNKDSDVTFPDHVLLIDHQIVLFGRGLSEIERREPK